MVSSPVEAALASDVAAWAKRGGLLFRQARHAASMNQKALASVSGTSRTTLSAYEHGRKSPTLETAGRILDAAGFRLVLEPKVEFAGRMRGDGRAFHVPSRLQRLPVAAALGVARLRDRVYDLADREQRRAAYTLLLCEGTPRELLDHVDGVLLADLWDELDLPPDIRAEWRSLVEEARHGAGVIN
ncbi:helix-turn-helix transcriptional regulator [Nonomuraea basaltis]|uniref:helix-turn-helix transcriptional regulator n=1 Tax=Nonomuraea basaltis TaxID=2495887 RepID=UPI00110C416F|nr:helix-turn-helix transcriptional regulator [Nonomuraea basaltis]TMR99091.1 helix-turn-helix transcriptional regulator [Nonomuraea basaltis]